MSWWTGWESTSSYMPPVQERVSKVRVTSREWWCVMCLSTPEAWRFAESLRLAWATGWVLGWPGHSKTLPGRSTWASWMVQWVEAALQGQPGDQSSSVESKGGRRELALQGYPVTSVIVPTHAFRICKHTGLFFFFFTVIFKKHMSHNLELLESAIV